MSDSPPPIDSLQPGWAVPGVNVWVKVGLLGPVVEIPALRCECGGDALPVDSSYDAQRDTIVYVCPDCRASWEDTVH